MTDAYRTEEREVLGLRAKVEWFHDTGGSPPWTDYAGHGEVTGWVPRGKHPGELVLCEDTRSGYKKYYDFAGTCAEARKDGWGHPDCPADATPRQRAAFAARKEYEYLKGWCDDDWWYCGIRVTMMSRDGVPSENADHCESLWRIEDSHSDKHAEYHEEVIEELVGIIITRAGPYSTDPTTD